MNKKENQKILLKMYFSNLFFYYLSYKSLELTIRYSNFKYFNNSSVDILNLIATFSILYIIFDSENYREFFKISEYKNKLEKFFNKYTFVKLTINFINIYIFIFLYM